MKIQAENVLSEIGNVVEKNKQLKEDYDKGKRIAASVIIKSLRKPAETLLRRWKHKTEESMISELKDTLQEKLGTFGKLQEMHDSLQGQNNNLLVENEDLKQTSMDGLEIANVNNHLYKKCRLCRR